MKTAEILTIIRLIAVVLKALENKDEPALGDVITEVLPDEIKEQVTEEDVNAIQYILATIGSLFGGDESA